MEMLKPEHFSKIKNTLENSRIYNSAGLVQNAAAWYKKAHFLLIYTCSIGKNYIYVQPGELQKSILV